MATISPVPFSLTIYTGGRLAPETELTVFRIAQEVLSNIRRHSHASAVEMTLDFGAEALTQIISDNSQGFNMPERTSERHTAGQPKP